jgi:hypothetical protein
MAEISRLGDWLGAQPYSLAMSSGFFSFYASRRGLRPRSACGLGVASRRALAIDPCGFRACGAGPQGSTRIHVRGGCDV